MAKSVIKKKVPTKKKHCFHTIADSRVALIGEKYEFEHIPKDRPYNEARYNAFISKSFTTWWKQQLTYCLLDLVGDLVEQELQSAPLNFQKTIIPVNANPSTDPHTYIYMTWVVNDVLDGNILNAL